MAEGESDQVVRDVARQLVTELAPQELPLFRSISDAYFKDPSRTLEQRRDGDEVLGFGVDAAVVLMTPVVLAVVKDVILHLSTRLADQAATEGSGALRDWLHGLFHKQETQAAATVPQLSPAQLAEVRQLAHDRALALKLSEARASSLADSLTAQLATQSAT